MFASQQRGHVYLVTKEICLYFCLVGGRQFAFRPRVSNWCAGLNYPYLMLNLLFQIQIIWKEFPYTRQSRYAILLCTKYFLAPFPSHTKCNVCVPVYRDVQHFSPLNSSALSMVQPFQECYKKSKWMNKWLNTQINKQASCGRKIEKKWTGKKERWIIKKEKKRYFSGNTFIWLTFLWNFVWVFVVENYGLASWPQKINCLNWCCSVAWEDWTIVWVLWPLYQLQCGLRGLDCCLSPLAPVSAAVWLERTGLLSESSGPCISCSVAWEDWTIVWVLWPLYQLQCGLRGLDCCLSPLAPVSAAVWLERTGLLSESSGPCISCSVAWEDWTIVWVLWPLYQLQCGLRGLDCCLSPLAPVSAAVWLERVGLLSESSGPCISCSVAWEGWTVVWVLWPLYQLQCGLRGQDCCLSPLAPVSAAVWLERTGLLSESSGPCISCSVAWEGWTVVWVLWPLYQLQCGLRGLDYCLSPLAPVSAAVWLERTGLLSESSGPCISCSVAWEGWTIVWVLWPLYQLQCGLRGLDCCLSPLAPVSAAVWLERVGLLSESSGPCISCSVAWEGWTVVWVLCLLYPVLVSYVLTITRCWCSWLVVKIKGLLEWLFFLVCAKYCVDQRYACVTVLLFCGI